MGSASAEWAVDSEQERIKGTEKASPIHMRMPSLSPLSSLGEG